MRWPVVWALIGLAAVVAFVQVLGTPDVAIRNGRESLELFEEDDSVDRKVRDGAITDEIDQGPAQAALEAGRRQSLPVSAVVSEDGALIVDGVKQAAESVIEAGSVEVAFGLVGGKLIASPATLFVACPDSLFDETIIWRSQEASVQTRLVPGEYKAVLRTATGYGSVASFVVGEEDVSVVVEAPRLFDLRVGVIDTADSAAVADARVACRRVDLSGVWPSGETFQGTTGPDGQVMLEGLVYGDWELSVEKPGYEDGRFETPLPGPWEPHLKSYGFIDMQQFGVAPMRTLSLQLVGAGKEDDLSLYSGNHSSLTPPVAFDTDGRLDMLLGSFASPLFLYVVYPDGQQFAMNLAGELPPDGEAVEVSVGGEGILEVDLRVSRAVREEIGESDCYLRVFFTNAAGDTRRVRQKAIDDGLFEFHGIQGEHATVCFHVEAETGRSDWVVQEVQVDKGETARVTLSVDSLPPRLQFMDESDTPIAGLWTELYVLPDKSTWHRGNNTDGAGRTTAPRIDEGQIAYHASKDGNAIFAVDALLPVLTPDLDTQVKLPGIEPTFVEVTVDGQIAPDVYVEIVGARSGRRVDASYTDAHGRSRTNGLTSESNAEFVVIHPGAWWGLRSSVLRPGFNKAELRSMGSLRGSSEHALHSAIDLGTGSSVGQWIEGSLAEMRAADSGGFEVGVPIGSYRINAGQENERNVIVAVGSTVRIED